MRDKQYGTAIIFQILLQPLNTLDVEVVGRLVEQKYRGTTQKQFGQLYSHTPTARELARGAVEVLALETQTEQRLFDVGLACVATEYVITVLCVVKTMQ